MEATFKVFQTLCPQRSKKKTKQNETQSLSLAERETKFYIHSLHFLCDNKNLNVSRRVESEIVKDIKGENPECGFMLASS